MRSKILELIYSAISEVNQQLPAGEQIAQSESVVIAGTDGVLDSLTLLTLIASAERHVEDAMHTQTSLASALMESEELPRTVGDLANRIVQQLEGGGLG